MGPLFLFLGLPDGGLSEMDENESKTEMVEQEQQPEQANTEMVQVSAAELAEIRAALKKANAEAAKHRKSAEAAEAERKAKEEAEMTELEKAKKRAAELEAELTRERITRMQTQVAQKYGLPEKIASRLQGSTLEEMEADAKEIADTLPKPTKPPTITATNPGRNGAPGETIEQKKARLFGTSQNMFDPDFLASKGGGVHFSE